MPRPATDLDLTPARIAAITTADALAEFFTALGYRTDVRKRLTPQAIGMSGEAAVPIREVELLAEDDEQSFRVLFVKVKSLTAKVRNDLVRVVGGTIVDHLLVLASDFDTLEFVFVHKDRRESRGPARGPLVKPVPLVFAVDRHAVGAKELRTLRRFTWTAEFGTDQFDKLRSVFEAAAYSEDHFCNRALFADHYLLTRLHDDPAWAEDPTPAFRDVQDLLRGAVRWRDEGEEIIRRELFEPLFRRLGFESRPERTTADDRTRPDYLLLDADGRTLTAVFTYPWDRWLDGPDPLRDPNSPDENPGACVVTALEEGPADWIVVTNGRQWRLYARHAHSRATNFYEVDLPEVLVLSGDTDPNEAFRYWWLFFRAAAFRSDDRTPSKCWLDRIAEESRDYARELGERLKTRIFEQIFPHLARGFLHDRRQRLGLRKAPTDDDLRDVFQGTLTLLYRLLFLLYAESRDLLPIREAPYFAASLKKLKQEIADKAGIARSEAETRIDKAFSAKETGLHDRLQRLFEVMDRGDAALNVPTYNGGLFLTRPDKIEADDPTRERELRIARFLAEHRVPDRFLALAIDLLSRDEDPKTFSLAFVDYKSLAVRHLGSIYEGLLEFRLKVADEDLATQTEKGRERYIPLSAAKTKRGRGPEAAVRAGEVYLSNDKAERKASGSYYTPDSIVEYIVAQTVGPVLQERLDALRPEFRKVRQTFDREVEKATAYPARKDDGTFWDPREFAREKVYASHKDLVEKLFEFRTLDPAMGSGHFLVEAVDFLTDRLLAFLNAFPINPVRVMLDRTRRHILAALDEQGVQVDPAKLTDVNLLKRHVLKRCIYGVDLNPMAVELAKVSLWLDAFTLGAPLSFLDHHLRCGNSLVGGTLKDLGQAIRGTLYGIDYEPLLRAIRHVLFVNAMSDATAAEVKQSAAEYEQARRDLSGYRVILDLLVAKHFGHPDAAKILVGQGQHLDLSSAAAFRASLGTDREKDKERRIVDAVQETARRPDVRFFHWEVEFPEVFYGFADADQRRIVHKDDLAPGRAGFDAVVGNPPYVRQETIKPLKEYLKTRFAAYTSGADLFVYFYDRGSTLLRHHGRLGYITSGSWVKAAFGEGVRRVLSERLRLTSLIDFGEWQPFPGAEMIRPTVATLARSSETSTARVFRHLVAGSPPSDLVAAVHGSPEVPTASLSSAEWTLESSEIETVFETMKSNGIALEEFVEGKIYRGVITGLTEAFVIPRTVRDQLLGDFDQHEEIVRPYLEGKHLRTWHSESSDLWVIAFPKGFTERHAGACTESEAESWFAARFPRCHEWLAPFRERARARHDQGDYWWELRACEYYEAFANPKIMWPDISKLPRFSRDEIGHVLGNTAYFVDSADPFLLAVLGSWINWFSVARVCQPLRLRGGRWQYRLFSQFMGRVVVPKHLTDSDRAQLGRLAIEASTIAGAGESSRSDPDGDPVRDNEKVAAIQSAIDEIVCNAFRLTATQRSVLRKSVET